MVSHRILLFNSEQHQETISLRNLVLRKPLGMRFTPEQLAEEKDQIHIGQYLDEELIACLVMKPINQQIVKMRQVAVHPNWQGRGYGKQLISFTENEMKQHGFTTIELHAREVAIPFYERLNYQVEGKPFLEIGLLHVKMIKVL